MLSRRGPSLPDTALIIALSCTTLTLLTTIHLHICSPTCYLSTPLTSLTQYTLAFP